MRDSDDAMNEARMNRLSVNSSLPKAEVERSKFLAQRTVGTIFNLVCGRAPH